MSILTAWFRAKCVVVGSIAPTRSTTAGADHSGGHCRHVCVDPRLYPMIIIAIITIITITITIIIISTVSAPPPSSSSAPVGPSVEQHEWSHCSLEF